MSPRFRAPLILLAVLCGLPAAPACASDGPPPVEAGPPAAAALPDDSAFAPLPDESPSEEPPLGPAPEEPSPEEPPLPEEAPPTPDASPEEPRDPAPGEPPTAPAPRPDPAADGEDAAAAAAAADAKARAAARDLIRRAAARQGTADWTGERSVRRFQSGFDQVFVHSPEGDRWQTRSVETFALPEREGREARLHSDFPQDGMRKILGHTGRFGWLWTEKDGTTRFTDPVKYARDIEDVKRHCRMLGLALRTFFLGNLAGGDVAVRPGPEEESIFPRGAGKETFRVRTVRLDREASPRDGEPPLRLHLDAKSLDPVAVLIAGTADGDPGFLLTFEYDEEGMKFREKGDIPEGMRVPTRLELFEIPAGKPPSLRIQADLATLVVDPARIPDSLFDPPK